jgi:predicted DNA-binding antitoxin AbrB/MazE fold protein
MEFQGEIAATYTNGMWKPDKRMDLPEGARAFLSVRLQQPTPESRKRGWETIERIRRDGLIRLRGDRFTRDDLYDRR